jgi:hypothetical protein
MPRHATPRHATPRTYYLPTYVHARSIIQIKNSDSLDDTIYNIDVPSVIQMYRPRSAVSSLCVEHVLDTHSSKWVLVVLLLGCMMDGWTGYLFGVIGV